MANSRDDNDYLATKPVDSTATGRRLALTTSSATATVVANARYKVRLSGGATAAAWFEFDGTATLPADNADGTGFYLDAGESEIVRMATTSFSGIMVSGTGTLTLTRIDQ